MAVIESMDEHYLFITKLTQRMNCALKIVLRHILRILQSSRTEESLLDTVKCNDQGRGGVFFVVKFKFVVSLKLMPFWLLAVSENAGVDMLHSFMQWQTYFAHLNKKKTKNQKRISWRNVCKMSSTKCWPKVLKNKLVIRRDKFT